MTWNVIDTARAVLLEWRKAVPMWRRVGGLVSGLRSLALRPHPNPPGTDRRLVEGQGTFHMSKHFRVALLIESSRAYGRQLLRGIASFSREHGNWAFLHQERSLGDETPLQLKPWRPDGIIARLAGAEMVREIRRLKVPVVDLFHEDAIRGIPRVSLNQDALVEMAIAHFVERGFQNFAYCGFEDVLFSRLRESRFIARLAEMGYSAQAFHYPRMTGRGGLAAIEAHAMSQSNKLSAWLKKLPKPVGVFACNDMRGHQVLTTCAEAGIAVPDEVAVLGVDNDDVQCELSNPPLSSIEPNAMAIGYEAARLLQKLLGGRGVTRPHVMVDPLRVVTRRSTDVLVIAHSDVADAVRFVRAHACEGIDADAVVQSMKVSRSTLERWFEKVLGHSLTDEIMRVRINRAAELLTTTRLTVEQIAPLVGFVHVETLSRIFKRRQGISPGQYRHEFNKE